MLHPPGATHSSVVRSFVISTKAVYLVVFYRTSVIYVQIIDTSQKPCLLKVSNNFQEVSETEYLASNVRGKFFT